MYIVLGLQVFEFWGLFASGFQACIVFGFKVLGFRALRCRVQTRKPRIEGI